MIPDTGALAVDLGGSWTRAAFVDASGDARSTLRRATPARSGPEAVVETIIDLLHDVMAAQDVPEACPLGVAAPGPLDPRSGKTFNLPNLRGFEGYPLAGRLSDALGREVDLNNDASAAALGEAHFGAGRGHDSMVYLTWSTGIGGGIVLDGRLLEGAHGLAGELGHVVIEDGGPACALGHAGCAEALASGAALDREASARLGQGATGPELAELARSGDALAHAAFERAARRFGLAAAAAVNALDPAALVIGGGVALTAWDLVEEPLRRVLDGQVLAWRERHCKLCLAELGDAAGLVGAACLTGRRQARSD